MKISEVKSLIERLERLSRNLDNLHALSTGGNASLSVKEDARKWSENIADNAEVNL